MKTNEEITLENLRLLVDWQGSIAKVARAANSPANYLSQILARTPNASGNPRNVGKKLARAIEDGLGLGTGWMDKPHSAEELSAIPASGGVREPGNIATPPRPVLAFEDGDPVNGDEVEVPRLTLVCSAGDGHMQWEVDTKGTPNRFRAAWLRREGLKAHSLATVVVKGDSMDPRVPDGASITINTDVSKVKNGKVHAIDYMDEFYVKRLFLQPDGSILVRSDNPDKNRYPDWIVPSSNLEVLRVLGYVVSVTYGDI